MDHYLLTRHVMSGMAVSVVESRISSVRAMFSPVTILSADMEYTPAVKGRGSTVKGSVDSVKFRTGGKYIIAITYMHRKIKHFVLDNLYFEYEDLCRSKHKIYIIQSH